MRLPELTPPERAALLAAIALLALHALGAAELLEYRRGTLAREPWRILTAHAVHVSWSHALVNGVALWVVARLHAPGLGAPRQGIALGVSALATSTALYWFFPNVVWYRGLSGALHGLYFAGGVAWLLTTRPHTARRLWLPLALVAGGWLKVLAEQPGAGPLPVSAWLGAAIVPQAHLAGAVCGSALGALFAATQLRREQQREQA